MSTSTSTSSHSSGAVVLVGDSLAEQTAPYLGPLLRGRQLIPQFFFGTAPCDWLGKDLQVTAGSVVVISFTGNSMTPCMADNDGSHLAGQAVVDKYTLDVTALIGEALTAGARVLLVGQPVRASSTPGNDVVAGLNHAYSHLANQHNVTLVDAGAAVENADGSFAQSLPCRPGEAECGPTGSNVIRSDDGLHFCPGSPPPGPCQQYPSGALHFATAIATAVTKL